ncbi:MAG: hypothetical protein CMO55_19050 [Verrucomicrobiales bacterium]|nr:hypothetical protein [Verrucomicrobiales bacterium]
MKLIRYNHPSSYFNDFETFFSEPFRAFEPFFRSALSSPYRSQVGGVEWFENEGNYVVRVDLPGVKKEDLHLDVEQGLLRLTWDLKESDGENATRTEKVERVLRCPEGVQTGAIEAKLEDGVLTLNLPKAEEKKPVNIAIK